MIIIKVVFSQALVTLALWLAPLDYLCPRTFKLSGFPIFRFWAYLMKVILDFPIFWFWAYLTKVILIFWFWAYLTKVILSVPDEGYFERTWWRLFTQNKIFTCLSTMNYDMSRYWYLICSRLWIKGICLLLTNINLLKNKLKLEWNTGHMLLFNNNKIAKIDQA